MSTPSAHGPSALAARRRGWVPGERLVGRDADPAHAAGAPTIGVLALQGDVLEHLRALRRCGANAVEVRTAAQLAEVDGLILPGGESTTIGKLLERFGLMQPLRDRIGAGLPVFGTCAGMILLSDELDQDRVQPLVGGLAVRTRRNAYGRQVDSFDTHLEVAGIAGGPMDVSFIRAPRVQDVLSDDVEVLASVDGHPVIVRQGHLLAAAFHPEVTGDDRLHAAFVAAVARARVTG
ncbi:MAG TPA: pyridoxal 5'-phosphate synthase glutaminase subunit PdxT [Egicoccus sp.]|nr:pyridoxal 5'-phosphate synthase glutaminase subunit PdxT [Egicoccus sp.]HSK24442.1 pyridoxal 5'-phosphate synthase glutaminase subunit PdxT [Egicoccus sp.]